jgi:hypothetical protein
MQAWAKQEEQERERFSKCGGDYNNNGNKQGNDHHHDRSQRNYLGSSESASVGTP